MTDTPQETGPPLTLAEIAARFPDQISTADELFMTLRAREDNMADIFRLAGMQFGLFPFIVSEVIAQVGLGTPPSEEERDLIRRAYVEGMEELQRQQQPPPPE